MTVPADLPDPARVTIRRRIEWMDTDAAGIYHWTTAFRLAEAAEAAMHTALGIVERTFASAPRVAVSAEFARALRFNDEVAATLTVAAVGRTSVTYTLEIAGPEGVAVRGRVKAVLVERGDDGAVHPRAWPEDVRAALAGGGQVTPG